MKEAQTLCAASGFGSLLVVSGVQPASTAVKLIS